MKIMNLLNLPFCSLLTVLALASFASASQVAEDLVVTANDADGDRIVDTIDIDDDNDGILDIDEISGTGRDVDSDIDGIPNRLDLDSDNDGILDWIESGAVIVVDFSAIRVVSGRILGEVGENGFVDDLETSIDNGQMRYTLLNSDFSEDDIPDVLDLDSDNDGLTDLREAGVSVDFDSDNDARIDIDLENSSVGNDGIPDRLQTTNDTTCCDVNGDGIEDTVPRNTDSADLPDFQDLDSDNDGVSDLVESGGGDFDRNGRVDNFFDSPVVDGMDDTILLIPFDAPDSNGNAVPDFIDEFAQSGAAGEPEQPTNTGPTPDTDMPAVEDEPTVDEPAVDEPAVDEPAVDEPAEDEPTVDEPAEDEPAVDEPAEDEPTVDEPAEDEPTADTLEPMTDADETVIRDPVDRPGSDILPGTESQPAEDDPGLPVVNTGLSASGCSLQSTGIDLIVLLLSVFSVAILGWRYTIRRVRR